MNRPRWPLRIIPCLVVLAVAPGCGERFHGVLTVNTPPEVRFTETRAEPGQTGLATYRLRWTGHDPDGRVDHYLVALDPRRLDAVDDSWQAQRENEFLLTFPAEELVRARASGAGRRDFHLFAVRAVDARGAISEPIRRAFFPNNIAPLVQILSPQPSKLISPTVPPSLQITWNGYDPDGVNSGYKPVKYKYKLYRVGDFPSQWLQYPDSMRAAVAPEFAGWDSVPGDTTSVQYTNMVPATEYLFTVVAIDEAGDYSPDFSLDSNMLLFYVSPWDTHGPRITLFNESFTYTYYSGGYPSDLTQWYVRVEVPARKPITFNWYGEPLEGSVVTGYRWAMDIADPQDQTPRSGPDDWSHWSDWSAATTSATVGPFAARGLKRETHLFYVEARDNLGWLSIGVVRFTVVPPTFTSELLIVDDTRLRPDYIVLGRPDSLQRPDGNWPTRAEMDTFLFAVGGVRWRMTPNGTLSSPGIFKGYSYDTLGTRQGRENPAIPLAILGQYKHVIWLTERVGAEFTQVHSLTQPITALRYMSYWNRQNTLSTWVQQGGKLWALGGAFGHATNTDWNNPNNDTYARTYSSAGSNPDLRAGRFMFDLAHWRSEFRIVINARVAIARLDQPDPTSSAPGAWPGEPFTNPEVDYSALPTQLLPKDPSTDPIWPYRTANTFYINNQPYSTTGIDLEYLSVDNHITDPIRTPEGPDSPMEVSQLDTLYLAYAPTNPAMLQAGQGVNALMTYYHGPDNTPLVFSGHDIWHFTRAHCVSLVDFVLNRLWGLQRSNLVTSAPVMARGARTVVARGRLQRHTPQTPGTHP
jgi:hypothetical protein